MADILNFICIVVLSVRLVIAGGRISKLEGKVDSLLIYLNAEANDDEKK